MITMQLSYTSLKHRGITIYSECWTVLGLFMKFFGEWKKRSFSLFLFNQHTNESTTSRTFKGAQCIRRGSKVPVWLASSLGKSYLFKSK